jgi:hypothetical protein
MVKEGVKLDLVYKLFKENVKDFQLIPVEKEKQVDVKPYQLRVISCNVPDYWLVTLDVEYEVNGFKLYRVLVLTEDVCLAKFKDEVPILLIGKTRVVLACLPFWVYLTDEFLKEYSIYFMDMSEELVDSMIKWVERVELLDMDDVRGRYIVDMMELTSWWNMNSIMSVVDACEEYEVAKDK